MKTYKVPLIIKVVSLYVLLLFVPVVYGLQQQPTSTASIDNNQYLSEIVAIEPEIIEPEALTGNPVRLEIPAVDIDLPVIDGEYDPESDTWTLSTTSVHIATMTAPINNQSGHTLIYGHNNRNLLAPTRDIVQYDELIIYTDNDLVFRYAYTGDELVDPTNTSLFDQDPSAPQITLLTCEGLFYEQRRLMSFELVEVETL